MQFQTFGGQAGELPMAVNNYEKVWHNGKFIPWGEATIHVSAHVVHYASSLFEGIRC